MIHHEEHKDTKKLLRVVRGEKKRLKRLQLIFAPLIVPHVIHCSPQRFAEMFERMNAL
jgi:hypothetical protein